MNKQQIHDVFWDKDKNEYKKLNANSYLEVIKPKDCTLNKDALKT